MGRLSTCWTCGAKHSNSGSWDCPACVRQEKAEKRAEERAQQRERDRQRQEAAQRAAEAEAARRANNVRIVNELKEAGAGFAASSNQRVQEAFAELTRPWEPPMAPLPETKECPDCAEEVKLKAKVCRFCSHRFEDVDTTIAALEDARARQIQALRKSKVQAALSRSSSMVELGLELYKEMHPDSDRANALLMATLQPGAAELLRAQTEAQLDGEVPDFTDASHHIDAVVEELEDTATLEVCVTTAAKSDGTGYEAFISLTQGGRAVVPTMATGFSPSTASDEMMLLSPFSAGNFNAARPKKAQIGTGTAFGDANSVTCQFLVPAGELEPGGVARVEVHALKLGVAIGPLNAALQKAVTEAITVAAGPADLARHRRHWMAARLRLAHNSYNTNCYAGTEDRDPAKVVQALQVISVLHERGLATVPESWDSGTMSSVEVKATPPAGTPKPAGAGGGFLANAAEEAKKRAALFDAKDLVLKALRSTEEGGGSVLDAQLARREELDGAIRSAKERQALVETVRGEWDEATQAITDAQRAVQLAEGQVKDIADELAEPLEVAVARGSIDHPAVAEANALYREIQDLKSRHAELDKVSGFFAVAKAKAEQVAITAQLHLADAKRKGICSRAAAAMMEAGAEGLIPGADEVLARLAERREARDAAVVTLSEVEKAREERRSEWSERLGEALPEEGPNPLVKASTEALREAEAARTGWPNQALEALLAADPADWPPEGHALRDKLEAWARARDEAAG